MEQSIEEISLREIVEILLRGKKIIIWVTLIAMLLSAVFSFLIISPTYEVTASVIVKQIDGVGSNSVIGSILNEQTVPINTLISAFDNVITGRRILEQVRKISPDFEDIQTEDLKEIIKINLVKDTTNVNITVNSNSPQDAMTLANIVLNRFILFVEEQNNDSLANKIIPIKRQMGMDMELLQDKITKGEQELSKLDKVIVYKKSIIDDPYLQELAARLGNTNVVNLSQLSVENETPNPAYMTVLDNITNNKLALSDLESQYSEIKKAERKLTQIAKEAGMKATIVREVIEPYKPIKPNKMLNISLSLFVGIILSTFYVFWMEYWNNSSKKRNAVS